jgi:hypothetical protein
MLLEIGKTVSFMDDIGYKLTGEIMEVMSDSYDDVRLADNVVTYWSKKKKMYVPVREKHKDSIFFEIKTASGLEYVFEKELM